MAIIEAPYKRKGFMVANTKQRRTLSAIGNAKKHFATKEKDYIGLDDIRAEIAEREFKEFTRQNYVPKSLRDDLYQEIWVAMLEHNDIKSHLRVFLQKERERINEFQAEDKIFELECQLCS